jgi:hypothetical protein
MEPRHDVPEPQTPPLPDCRCGCPAHPGRLCLETLDCLCTGYDPVETAVYVGLCLDNVRNGNPNRCSMAFFVPSPLR